MGAWTAAAHHSYQGRSGNFVVKCARKNQSMPIWVLSSIYLGIGLHRRHSHAVSTFDVRSTWAVRARLQGLCAFFQDFPKSAYVSFASHLCDLSVCLVNISLFIKFSSSLHVILFKDKLVIKGYWMKIIYFNEFFIFILIEERICNYTIKMWKKRE